MAFLHRISLHGTHKNPKNEYFSTTIIYGIGFGTHKIASVITNILTQLLGTISSAHLKNSGDLLKIVRDI